MPIRYHVYRLAIFTFSLWVSGLATHTSHAETVTPNQVYQVTEDVLAQLERLHDANLSIPNLMNVDTNLPDRQPRHVLQQALNVRSKIQLLKRVNGLEPSEIKPPKVKEVTPSDVLIEVQTILNELTEFDKTFNLPPFKKQAKAVEGKTPTDVYLNLLRAQAMIVQLGIPDTIPNEVFNNVLSVSEEIKLVAAASNKKTDVEPPSPSIGKKPADAYSLAYYALKGLKGLTRKPEYKIPNDIVLPKRKTRNITSSDVQQLLLFCLAELSSMKVAVGATAPLMMPKPAAGQTPTTVFDKLGLVNRQIQAMVW
ncbi:hypothetical protein [Terasakiella sp.]|uniref:hypothetical protein n=1 Tax=Terasakiella sp. TaxID=2034861 RepID=UPI003AA84477